jgi:uncharacterized membrane protein
MIWGLWQHGGCFVIRCTGAPCANFDFLIRPKTDIDMPISPSKAHNPLPLSAVPVAQAVDLAQPLQWLARAWRDMTHCGWVSYLHGVVMALVGAMMLVLVGDRFWFMAGAFSGFLLVAPILATSLYALSRALERGETPSLGVVLKTWLNWQDGRIQAWGPGHWRLVQFGVLLAAAGTTWVLLSAAMITLLAPVPITTPTAFIEHVVLAKGGLLFEFWLALGGVLVAPIFASTVVTIPLLLDRQLSITQAVAASWQVIFANPAPMALWGALIMVLTLLGFATALVGLVVLVPVLGHASWHAYRDLLDVSGVPEREQR